ncbi:MAG: acetyl-CoA carboxylase biotin carboxylase subunit [Coriobacteriia bacterium]|nr:acetyl-CoA carboxylase biotin carboxylase subunit [Coriobacteriia bacterium]
MIKKLLIANRGEIALRIIRAAREMGIATVAVYSEIDADSLPVRMADEAVCVGPAPSIKSYLVQGNIIAAAENLGADAIHPGYGFLSENADFARACAENDIIFVGPSADAIERMGNKARARATAEEADVPVVPGSDGVVETVEEARAFAEKVGYPVLIKASAGGGGKGMRVAESADDLESQFTAARTEAAAAFGNDEVYLEKYLMRPRHIEIQILADTHGNVVHLFERDCSIQRRHQKLIEEAPSPALTPELRATMGEAAVKLARAVDYVGAGTVELLLDTDGSFYFMEMNTRVQVEHPVTEQITGIDIVKEQLRIASGETLSFTQDDVKMCAHSIEFRINAEDPLHDFRPNPGRIDTFMFPGGIGVRVDTHCYPGYSVPPTYDSMIAKLIVWGDTREEALARAARALDEMEIGPIPTTVAFHRAAIQIEAFQRGEVYTDFVDTHEINLEGA